MLLITTWAELAGEADISWGTPEVCREGGGSGEGASSCTRQPLSASLWERNCSEDPEGQNTFPGPQGLLPNPRSSQGSQEKAFKLSVPPSTLHHAHAGEDERLRNWLSRGGLPAAHISGPNQQAANHGMPSQPAPCFQRNSDILDTFLLFLQAVFPGAP